MTRPPRDDEREERIAMKITADAYSTEEEALGWYYYLEENLHFPFKARCTTHHTISPLEPREEVEVVGIPSEEDCEHDMLVLIHWQSRKFGVPLSQLEGIQVDEETQQAIEDWHYWVDQDYKL